MTKKTDRKERVAAGFQVVFDDGENFMSGPVVDVSESGMYSETVMPPKAGTMVRITPLLPENAGLFEFEGEVVRANEVDLDDHFDRAPGIGVRFIDISDQDRENLRALVEKAVAAGKST